VNDADELTLRGGDERGIDVEIPQARLEVLDRHIGAHGRRSLLHQGAHRPLRLVRNIFRPHHTEHDPTTDDDGERAPIQRPLNVLRGGVDGAREHVTVGDRPDPELVRPPAFGRLSGGDPVGLTRGVVEDLLAPELLEPARGSCAQVSKLIPAVHDDGPGRVERLPSPATEVSQRDADGSGQVFLLERISREHLHQLGAVVGESPPHLLAFQRRDHQVVGGAALI
jgi:hypothetical protein